METQELIDKYSPFLKRNLLSIALGLFGLIFFVYGLIALFGELGSSNEEVIFKPRQEHFLETDSQIKVDVAGGVINPGVYSLKLDARIQDALVAAGGLSENADREWVSKTLNLAQKLADGTKIYIPKIGETLKSIASSTSTTGGMGGQININIASSKELESLPGVGVVTAQKIIDSRPYSMIEDLLSKKVVSQKVFGEIREKITAY